MWSKLNRVEIGVICVLDDTGRSSAAQAAPRVSGEKRDDMWRSAMTLGLACAAALLALEPVSADGNGRVICTISENGQPASGVVSLQQNDKEITSGSCGKEFSVPAGTYSAALRLDGAFDGPELKQNVVVEAGAVANLSTNFETGSLEIRIVSHGKRAAGMAIIKRGAQQLGTLGSGVVAHLSVGTYRVIVRYRAQEKDLGAVSIATGQRVTLDAAFE
jgi:hypothetical protein